MKNGVTHHGGGAVLAFVIATLLLASVARAGQDAPPDYGLSITLEQARVVTAAARAESAAKGWRVAIAVVDAGGHLVLLERMDGTQFGSLEIARQKAWTAAAFRRPSKAFEDMIAAGGAGVRMLRLEGATPIEGGIPLLRDGRIVGAIGVSGATSEQDGIVGRAGAAALK
jgi:glc operon protein GlcG